MKRDRFHIILLLFLFFAFSLHLKAMNAGNPLTGLVPESSGTIAGFLAPPTAVISGSQEICEEESAQLTVILSGKKPWQLAVSDGQTLIKFDNIKSSPFKFWVKPASTTTYTIAYVLDSHKVIGAGSGSAVVTVNLKTEVNILNLKSGYNIDADPVPLQANVSGGTFSGTGVTGPPWYFNPGTAGTAGSPYTILYTYTNEHGCTSSASALIHVVAAQGVINTPAELFCGYDNPFTVTASNGAGITGTFSLLNSSGQSVQGLTDNHDNTAKIDPRLLNGGIYKILYKYIQFETTLSLSKSFTVESVPQPHILIPNRTDYCQNENRFQLQSDIESAIFTGTGVSGNLSQGFFFTPANTSPGNILLTCTNTSAHGCVSSSTKTLNILVVPQVNFSVNNSCVGPEDTVSFSNSSQNKNLFSQWKWNFGDPGSGSLNLSNLEEPYHIYSTGGPRNITLTGITAAGCSDTLKKTVSFASRPTGSFRIVNDCYIPGDSSLFISSMEPSGSITKYTWKFFLPDNQVQTIPGGASLKYLLDATGEYQVALQAENGPGCSLTVQKAIYLKPVVPLAEEDYYENFEKGTGLWLPVQNVLPSYQSWNYGVPGFNGLTDTASETWYIRDGTNTGKESFLNSPCYDFRGLERPMIRMNIFRSMIMDHQGAALQASFDNNTWITIGAVADGINWYNSDQVAALPGGQETGWTGTTPFSPDTGWVESRHDLNSLADSARVRLRIAYADDQTQAGEGEGFALGNVWIGPRKRHVLLEHFTNSSDEECRRINSDVNIIMQEYPEDLVKLEYHTDFPGYDPFNDQNPSVPATRTFFYGITSVPYSILDGGVDNNMLFDYQNASLTGKDVKIESLTDPKFRMDLTVQKNSENLAANVRIIALKNLDPDERILQVAIYEKLITGVPTANGESKFIHVIKAMVPNAAGTAIFNGWSMGETRNYQFNWTFENVYDPGMLRVAAFIQNDNTKEIYQAVTDDTTGISTGEGNILSATVGLVMYPNPATSSLTMYLTPPVNHSFVIEFYDQLGRMVRSVEWQPADIVKEVDLSGMKPGFYFVRLKDEKGIMRAYRKLVIIR